MLSVNLSLNPRVFSACQRPFSSFQFFRQSVGGSSSPGAVPCEQEGSLPDPRRDRRKRRTGRLHHRPEKRSARLGTFRVTRVKQKLNIKLGSSPIKKISAYNYSVLKFKHSHWSPLSYNCFLICWHRLKSVLAFFNGPTPASHFFSL